MTTSSSWLAALLLVLGCGEAKVASEPTIDSTGTAIPVDGGFVSRSLVDNGTTYKYSVFVPKGFDVKQKWPIILSLHGSGEKGTDGVKPTTTGLGLVVRAQTSTFPAVVVFPQMPPIEGLGRTIYTRIAIIALDKALREFNGDPARQYLTGLSLGGDIGYVLASQAPTRFAAFAPISAMVCDSCVTGNPTAIDAIAFPYLASRLKTLPTWVFQGANDPNVLATRTRQVIAAFQAGGVPVTYTEYPNASHNTWDAAYNTPALFTWLFAQHTASTTGS
jgi:predicted peptidase